MRSVKRNGVAFLIAGLLMCPVWAGAAAPAGSAKKPAQATAPAASSAREPAVVDSIGLLQREIGRDSTRFDPLYKLGILYLDRDRVPEATQVLMRAHHLKPDHVGALVNLGAAYDAAANPDVAQTYYRKALDLAPGDSIATCKLASSLYAKTQYADAVQLLRDLIAAKPRAYCAYFTLGVAFADAGIYREAIRMWQKVVEIAPDSPEAVSAKESIEVLEKFMKPQ
jgi:tetratricopeptide (TPR) repeat protein